jgi:hypothetical protein
MPFNFLKVCEQFGLKPNQTSLHKAKCLYYGLDPTSTRHEVVCRERGLNPDGTPSHVLRVIEEYNVDPRTGNPALQNYLLERIENGRYAVRKYKRARKQR